MRKGWKNVRVFISSTFRDMHLERDHLVRFVFPELKERCRARRIHLIDVDLRWGVTEKDAQDGKALDICLDEIDTCRPYFIGILGHRYGYIPQGHDHSITAQEIYHGVLHTNIPRQVVDLRKILEEKLGGVSLTNEEKNCLARCYRWDAEKNKYLIGADTTPQEIEIIRSAFSRYSIYQRDRSFFFFRSESLTRKIAKGKESDFFEQSPDTQKKLSTLKEEIAKEGLLYFEYDDLEIFGHQVLNTLWGRIEAEAEVRSQKEEWEQENELHELFMAERTRRFIGRLGLLGRMHAFCLEDGDPSILLIGGEPGYGKSALMAHFTDEATRAHPDWLIIPHFVGASPDSTNIRKMLHRICTHLSHSIGSNEPVPQEMKELVNRFPELLTTASQDLRILIVIDALNQLQNSGDPESLSWLSPQLPGNVRFVLSTVQGDVRNALLARRKQVQEEVVTGLAPLEIQQLVERYLKEIRHHFPTGDVEHAFYGKVKSGNPLYILVALEELRVFGQFDELRNKVDLLPDTLPLLFDQVLERIEQDFNPDLVSDCMKFIACGRYGMTSDEMQTLLKHHAPVLEATGETVKLPDMLWTRLYRSFSSYLFERSGVIDFFHGQLKEAVGNRYLKNQADREAIHRTIADYFEDRWREPYERALDELPHQRTKAQDWEGVERTLCDLVFIRAKCEAEKIYDLQADYETALNSWPGYERYDPFNPYGGYSVGPMPKWLPECTAAVIAGSKDPHPDKGAGPVLAEIESSGLSGKSFNADKVLFDFNQTLPDRYFGLDDHHSTWALRAMKWAQEAELRDTDMFASDEPSGRVAQFSAFFSAHAHLLLVAPEQSIFLARNHAREGAVVETAEPLAEALTAPWIARDPRPGPVPTVPALIRTLQGHQDWVEAVALSQNGKQVLSACGDGNLRLWDVVSGRCRITISTDSRNVSATPDLKLAVTCGKGRIDLWDLTSGRRICFFEIPEPSIPHIAITHDGAMIVSADRVLRLWDVANATCVRVMDDKPRKYLGITVTPDGKLAACWDKNAIYLWDITRGKCIQEVKIEDLETLCITPDARLIFAAANEGMMHVWSAPDAELVREWHTLGGKITNVRCSSDGRIAVSLDWMGNLKVENVSEAHEVRHYENTLSDEQGMDFSPNCRIIASAGGQKDIRIWATSGLKSRPLPSEKAAKIASVPGSKRFITLGRNLTVWESGAPIQSIQAHKRGGSTMAVSGDGKFVASANDDSIKVWHFASGACLRAWDDLGKFCGHIYGVSFTADNRMLVTASGDGGRSACLWDIVTGELIHAFALGPLQSIVIRADGKTAISASGNQLYEWNLLTGEPLKAFPASGVKISIITADGKFLIAGLQTMERTGPDKAHIFGEICIWDIDSGEFLKRIHVSEDPTGQLSVTPDGNFFISGGFYSDTTIRVSERSSGECVAIYAGADDVPGSITPVSPDGTFACLLKNDDIHVLHLRNLHLDAPVITPVYRYHFQLSDFLPQSKWKERVTARDSEEPPLFSGSDEIPGHYEDALSCVCPFCGNCFMPSENTEPCECPHCGKQLKLNPFCVDNRILFR
ncbi:DUF4062 domain-containing protein [bacterium]|nr:DUF4062 domain-containing protein [bacterium]